LVPAPANFDELVERVVRLDHAQYSLRKSENTNTQPNASSHNNKSSQRQQSAPPNPPTSHSKQPAQPNASASHATTARSSTAPRWAQAQRAWSTTEAPSIRHLASSFRSSGAVKPQESRKTRQRHDNRSGNDPQRGICLRGLHLWRPNSQSEQRPHDKMKRTWRSNPQRHLRLDRRNCAEVFPHVHRRCHSDDISLCTQDKDGKGSECSLKFRNIFQQDRRRIKLI